jgi:hypothetical protein
MNVIYPLGIGSRWANMEIKLSVEQIRKHSKEDLKIWIAGVDPKMDGTHFVSQPKFLNSKYRNVALNLKTGLEAIRADNSNDVVLMNDDFFCVKDFSFNEMPLYYGGLATEWRDKINVNNHYRKALTNSIKSPEDLNFAVHYPMPIRELDLFSDVLELALKGDYSIRILYGNASKDKKVELADKKFAKNLPFSEIEPNLAQLTWFSVGDQFMTNINREKIQVYLKETQFR